MSDTKLVWDVLVELADGTCRIHEFWARGEESARRWCKAADDGHLLRRDYGPGYRIASLPKLAGNYRQAYHLGED